MSDLRVSCEYSMVLSIDGPTKPAPEIETVKDVEGTDDDSTRVLLVDDEPLILRAMRRTLERAGFTVTVAEDGKMAEELLASRSFNVVVSDIRMPRMSGLQLLAALRTAGDTVPVVLMSASPTSGDSAEAVRLGVVALLFKPVDLPVLIKTVWSAIHAYPRSTRPS